MSLQHLFGFLSRMFSIPDTLGEIYSFILSVINKTGKSTSSGKNEMFIFQQLLYFITYLFFSIDHEAIWNREGWLHIRSRTFS